MEDNTIYTYDIQSSFPLVFIKCNGAWYRKVGRFEMRSESFLDLSFDYMENYYFREKIGLVKESPLTNELITELVQAKLLGLID